jgi:hypothetical protein
MKRVKDVFGELRDLADVAYEIYKSSEPYGTFTPEYSAANKLVRDFQDSIAPELVVSLRKAQEWIREKHSVVYCGSNWTNCFGKEEALFEYVGFNRYRMDRERGEEEFKVVDVSPKQMIVDGYKYYKILVDREVDVLAAGGVDTERVFVLEDAISSMLLDLKEFDDQLESV